MTFDQLLHTKMQISDFPALLLKTSFTESICAVLLLQTQTITPANCKGCAVLNDLLTWAKLKTRKISHEKSSSNATSYKEYPVLHITILLILANEWFLLCYLQIQSVINSHIV